MQPNNAKSHRYIKFHVLFSFFHILVFIVTLRSGNEAFWDFVFSLKVICEHCFDITWLLYSQSKSINILRKKNIAFMS